MEDERIEAVETRPQPKSVQDIQVFIQFANFYRRFIQDFSRIAAPLTSMLKTASTTSSPASVRAPNGFDDEMGIGDDGGEVGKTASPKTR